MKVKIGPYLYYYGPYQIAELLKKVGVSEERCYVLGEYISEKFPLFDKLCMWFYNKRKRQIKVHIDNYDIWSMDDTLAHIILPMLKLLKEKKHGSPMVDNEDLPEHLRHNNWASNESMQLDMFACEETDNLIWDSYRIRWNWILDEMIWAFEQKLTDDWDEQYWKVKPELDLDDYPEDEGKEVIPVRWKCDYEGRQKHQDRISNGFRLFGKYYEGLWD